MKMKGFVSAFGHTKKEKKDETVYTHNMKIENKKELKLEISSHGKAILESIKKDGQFKICPGEVVVTIKLELAIKKEKFDKEDENLLPGTGDPWFKLTRTISNGKPTGIEISDAIDAIDEIKKILSEDIIVEFV